MGDPLSITSGVAGIVSLGLTVYGGLHTYFSALKDRGEDVERACELLSLLGKYVELIRPSAPTLSNQYAQASDLVTMALRLCESELTALERTIDKLSRGKSTWEKSKSTVAYPFNQTKLLQVQDRLFRATGVLGTVVQLLILGENTCSRNDIDALKNAVQDNGSLTQDFLRRIQNDVETIGSSIQPTAALLTEISARAEKQKAMASSTHEQIQSTSAMLSEKLDSVVQGQAQLLEVVVHQRQTIEAVRKNDAPKCLRNAALEAKSIQAYTAGICSCGAARRKILQQSLQRYKLWGGLTILRQVDLKGHHERGCRFYKEDLLEKSTKTTFTYTGLRYILSLALNLTLERQCQDGGYSIKHSLRTYNMREMSKAFDIFSLDTFPESFSTSLVDELKTKLQDAYSLPDVSPLDVDEFGRNTAHLCIICFGDLLNYSTSLEEAGRLLDGLQMLLSFLFKAMHVDIFVGENHNGSMLEYLIASGFPSLLPRVYDVLKRFRPELEPGFDQKPMWARWDDRAIEHRRHLRIFRDAFHDRPGIIEDLGYGELFLAVSKRDKSRLQELINSTNFAQYLTEKDFFRHNVLHLCITWTDGLKLLLNERATHPLANKRDSSGSTPLHYALVHSGNSCYSADGTENGSFDDAASMLLDTDCPVVVDLYCDMALEDSSPGAAMLLLQHLKLRRERLRNLAITHLPKSDLQELGVTENELPDTTAAELWNRLQSLYQKGTIRELNNSLDPLGQGESPGSHLSIFHSLSSPRDAEKAFSIGFQSIDTPNGSGVTPILQSALHNGHPLRAYERHLIYADWLIEKGAELDYSMNSLKLSAAHNLARVSAWWARAYYVEDSVRAEVSPSVERVLSALCCSKLQSCLPCPCSPGKLSRPLHCFFATALGGFVNPESWSYQEQSSNSYPKTIHLVVFLVDLLHRATAASLDMASVAKSIIHLLTMGCLGIRHLEQCHKACERSEGDLQKVKLQEGWTDTLEENQSLIDELEKMAGEFEQEFLSQKISIKDFLWNHWLKRMRKEWKERKPLSEQQKQDICDMGVVLESGYDSNCDLYDSEDEDEEGEVEPVATLSSKAKVDEDKD